MNINNLMKTSLDINVKGIVNNSKMVMKDYVFVCTSGVSADRHDFIDEAIDNGACLIITSKDVVCKVPCIKVDNIDELFLNLVKGFNDNPQEKLKLIGITGTDGKTSVATIIYKLMNKLSRCGYIGTNGIYSLGFEMDNDNTTPGIEVLYPALKGFVDDKCVCAALEITSEALAQGRANELEFDVSILTNITSDHMNTHKTIENYVETKSMLFDKTSIKGVSILNIDDKHYDEVLKHCKGKVLTYGKANKADYKISDIKMIKNKTIFNLEYNKSKYLIESPLECEFNVYNLVAAIAALNSQGYDIDKIISLIGDLNIDGRMNHIIIGQNFHVIIDYAHTVNGITSLFESLRKVYTGKFIVVSGIAGERDKQKRPEIGELLTIDNNIAIITTEDPRFEDPNEIVNDLLTNVREKKNFIVELNRYNAIKKAIYMAKENDVVLVLGKGKESLMKIKGKKVFFNDYEVSKAILIEKLYNEAVEY